MTTVLADGELRALIGPEAVIRDGDPANVDRIKYDFRQGRLLLKASYSQPIDIMNLPEADRAALRIDAGEVVFIVTEEVLAVPSNMMVQLSPKRGLMQSGVLTLGGGIVDPGYHGVLWIGLYNLSSTSVPLRRGKKIIAGVFQRLADGEAVLPLADGKAQTEFPDELVQMIQSYRPVELRELREHLDEARRHIRSLQDELAGDKSWKESFRAGLDEQTRQIDKLLASLSAEKEAREQGDRRVEDRLGRLDTGIVGVKWAWGVVVFVVGVAATALLARFFPALFGH